MLELSNNLKLQMTQYEILHQTLESFVFIMKKEEVQKVLSRTTLISGE